MTNNRRELLGSPIFSNSNGDTISTTETVIFDFSQNATASEKYAPFNLVTITNNSTQDINVAIDQQDNKTVRVPASSIRSLDKKSVPAVRSFLITNLGSSNINADEITIEVQKEVIDTETIISGVARRFLDKGVNLI